MTAIIRRSPGRALTFYRPAGLLDEVERLAKGMWDTWPVAFPTGFMARLDMYEKDDQLVVKAELPGIKKTDMDISLEDDVLTIKAEKKQEEATEEATYYASERTFGEYSRTVSLPFPVDAEKISASLKNGLLTIKLPKAEEDKPRRVEVNVR